MAGGAEQAAQHLWKEWGIQSLVLLSFTLQVALLVLAELRRRVDSAVLRLFVWSAYMLADATAIYCLGHMSVSSRRPEHQLMALWAPLLLMHLGGQDNITAYAIEDNKLWLRHLQTLAVQVAAAAYVLYESSILSGGGGPSSSSARLRRATILMFSVGVVKYGERVWALRCAGSTPSGTKYRTFQTELIGTHTVIHLDQIVSSSKRPDTEACLLMAQRLVHIPKNLLKGPLPSKFDFRGTPDLCGKDLYRVVEMQLSIMHDIFYTKAEVMHTWYAPFIRTFSLLGTASAFWLFHLFCHHHHRSLYSRVDVTVTYALLVGALVLEMTSALRGLFSSWLCMVLVCVGGPLGSVLVYLRRLVRAADWGSRYWSGSLGQHNLLQLCARSRSSRISKVASWMGVEDWWNTLAYSGSIQISASIEQLVLEQVLKSKGVPVTSPDHILNSRGRAALKSCRLHQGLEWSVDPDRMGLEESILAWHIATNIYLSWYKDREQAVVEHVGSREKMVPGIAKAIDALSNYMLFLLAARPFMLSPTASRNAYVEMCYGLTRLQFSSPKDLTSLLRRYGDALNGSSDFEFVFLNRYSVPQSSLRNNETLKTGCKLGAKLVGEELQDSPGEDTLKLIAQVWVEMLCYASRQCSAYSHAKQLGNGGELATVAAILVEHVTTNPQYEWIEDP